MVDPFEYHTREGDVPPPTALVWLAKRKALRDGIASQTASAPVGGRLRERSSKLDKMAALS